MSQQIENSLRETQARLDIAEPREFATGRTAGEAGVADIFEAAAETARLERGRLNGLGSFVGDGAYGDRVARAYADAATAVQRTGTGDAEEELEIVGQVLQDGMYGPAVRALGQGFVLAAAQFAGRSGVDVLDLGVILSSLIQGAQEATGAQAGQGTLLDVLLPAQAAFNAARERNLAPGQLAQGTLGAATVGMRRTARMPGAGPKPKPAGREDPGAAAAQVLLTGIVKGLIGRRVPPTPPGESTDNFILNFLSQGIDLFDVAAPQPTGTDL